MPRRLSLVFLEEWCTGCGTCAMACDDLKDRLGEGGRPSLPGFRRVSEEARGGFPREGSGFLPEVTLRFRSETCRHCARPACRAACDRGAIIIHPRGPILIRAEDCDGCGACAPACPFGAIVLDPGTGRAGKCDLCLGEIEAGRSPACVGACPLRALALREGP